MDAAVVVDRLHKRYGLTVAVDDVSFEVAEGEIFGLLGPNGSGKTTTVECIQGLRRPDGGSIGVFGHDPAKQPAQVRRLVGSQLQESALPDRLRVWEALHLFSTISPGGPLGSNCWRSGGSPNAATPPSETFRVVSVSGCSSPWRWSGVPRWSCSTS